LDEANGIVHNDDRVKLLPILMRLLYGKFHSNETTHTSSKDKKSNKRSTIIQFLSQCSEYELNYFFNLIFDCVNTTIGEQIEGDAYLNSNPNRFELNEVCFDGSKLGKILICLNDTSNVSSLFDLKRCIPFKKLLGILQSLEIVIKKLARQMESFSHRILHMLGFIHKYALTMFEKIQAGNKDYLTDEDSKTTVDEYYLNLLKIIRQQATLRFKQVELFF
jgi:hypothetical protein